MTNKKIPNLIDFVTPSEEADSLHEAGHACAALVVGLTPAFIEFSNDPNSLGRARSRLPRGSQLERRIVACAAFAVEYHLYKSKRLVDASGAPIDERTFIQTALGQNASEDKKNFFDDDLGQLGSWPKAYDKAFANEGIKLADSLPMNCVFALAEGLLNERRLDCPRIIQIAAQHLPAHLASTWKCADHL
jgi:hypothetical protein